MQKIYSSLAVVLTIISSALMAQTTITSVAMPQIGYVYNMAADTTPADLTTFTVSAGSSTAQSWDYSGMFNSVYGETTTFVAPSAGAGSSSFPNATMAVAQPNGTDWVYFLGNPSGFFIDGAYVNVQGSYVALDLAPNSLFMATPSTYGYNNNAVSLATFTTVSMGYTVQVRHSADRTVTADAFGSLITPTATYSNTLRVKTYEKTIDSAFFYILGSWNFAFLQTDTTTTYNWLQNTQDAQLMEIDMDKTGKVSKATYLQSFSNGIATFNEPNAGFAIYPNPASEKACLSYENKTSGPVSLQMYDINGRLVGDLLNENQAIGMHKILINIESMHLPKGIYHLRLTSGENVQNIKLSVN